MRSKITSLVFVILLIAALPGCSASSAAINCPFTELSWDADSDDMIALEGSLYENYDSIYKGLTYTYPKDYLGSSGMIKYMYDNEGKLCNVSWSYTSEDEDSVMKVYRDVCSEMEKLHGSSINDDGIGNYCEIWTSGGGTVMASAVITNDTKVMQIAYMNPEISKQGK